MLKLQPLKMDEGFEANRKRLFELRLERAGREDALAAAEAEAKAAKLAADEARVNAVAYPALAAEAAEKERAFEAALEARDTLAARGADVDAAITTLENKLGREAGRARAAFLAAAAEQGRAEVFEVREAVQEAMVDAAVVVLLEKREGPFEASDIGAALADALKIDLEAVRLSAFREADRVRGLATAPLAGLGTSEPLEPGLKTIGPGRAVLPDDPEARRAMAQFLSNDGSPRRRR